MLPQLFTNISRRMKSNLELSQFTDFSLGLTVKVEVEMASLLVTLWSEFCFTFVTIVVVAYIYFKLFSSKYWKDKNIPHLDPVFLIGNTYRARVAENFSFILADFYKKYKHHKLLGFWNFTRPALLVNDIELIKSVLIQDFGHFRDRGLEVDFHTDPLSANLFNVGGAKWRNLRVKLTPTFTSGKIKMMYPIMLECAEELKQYLENVADSEKEVEVKDILARFTTDIISSCAFGIQTNSLKNPNSEFRQYGKKIFEPSAFSAIKGLIMNISPGMFKKLKFRFTRKDVSEFFLGVVKDTMEQRERQKIRRNDFLQLLIELKNKGRLEDVDGVIPAIPGGDIQPTDDTKFTFNEAAAQAFVFFAAGFETSSTTMTFALYELALNPDVQEALQKEINEALTTGLTYEIIMDLKYLDCVVQETLRKYPPVAFLIRKCNKEYKIPELNVRIPNKTGIFISVLGIHKDPQIYPDPEKFNPMRFTSEQKAKRHNFTHLPFGEGPRNCIGSRFGLLQTKVGLVSILSKYNVAVTKNTPVPIIFDKRSFVLSPESGMPLKFERRK